MSERDGTSHPNPRASAPRPRPGGLPDRYRMRESEDGRFLVCEEAPRIRVNIHPANAFSESEARELGEGIVLLDGAGSFGPLLDTKKRLYNLDHHEGCERAFTLATCEQALLLVHSGLELAEGDWTIYANEPDLDTVLAIWCLLNFQRVAQLSSRSRDVLFPLIRLEGAIDANGAELAKTCGLPAPVFRETQERLDRLIARESALKSAGTWHEADWSEFTLKSLEDIDSLIYAPMDFQEYASVEEIYGHCEIAPRRIAVACRDRSGIYDVEQNLKDRWGDQLCLVALEKEPGHFTLRRTAALSGIELGPAYDLLNRVDPSVDGRPPSKRWGGSSSIGGSPRVSGTGLGAQEILNTLQAAYTPPRRVQTVRRVLKASIFSIGLMVVATLASLVFNVLPGSVPDSLRDTVRLATFAAVALLVCGAFTPFVSNRRTWLFGWRRPTGRDWLWLVPVPIVAALPNRTWVPQELHGGGEALAAAVATAALAALACEFWFRGLVHGAFLLDSGVQRVGGPWQISVANWVSSILFALVTAVASLFWVAAAPIALLSLFEELIVVFGISLLGGLALGAMRERSLSLWPGVFVQWIAGLATLWCWSNLPASLLSAGPLQ